MTCDAAKYSLLGKSTNVAQPNFAQACFAVYKISTGSAVFKTKYFFGCVCVFFGLFESEKDKFYLINAEY